MDVLNGYLCAHKGLLIMVRKGFLMPTFPGQLFGIVIKK